MRYHFKTNSGNFYPVTAGIWTETGNATGVMWDGLNIGTSPMVNYTANSVFASGANVLVCQAKSLNYVSGQMVTGNFTGCFPIAALASAAALPSSFDIKLVIKSITTDATATAISTLFSGVVAKANNNLFGHNFTGSYSGATMTGNFALSCEVGLVTNIASTSGQAQIRLGDSVGYVAVENGNGHAWFMDSNNLSGIPGSGNSVGWTVNPDFRVPTSALSL